MPELRVDPLSGRAVLLAPERAARGVPSPSAEPPDPEPCDFCPGQEHRTPAETYRTGDTTGWRVRVVPNLYPASAWHEVVVHCPGHRASFEDLPEAHRLEVVGAYASRAAAAPTRCVLPFFNRGRAAGASRSHEHGQVVGLELVPPTLRRECRAMAGAGCVACRLREQAPAVAEHPPVAVVAHPAPLVAHELLLLPECAPRLEASGGLAEGLAHALRALRAALGPGLATNVVWHTAPRGVRRFHWHAHVYPRTATWGGLELGAELPVVAADPGATAALLSGEPRP